MSTFLPGVDVGTEKVKWAEGKFLFWKLVKIILFRLLLLNKKLSPKFNGFKWHWSLIFAHDSVIWTGFSAVSSFLSIQYQLGSFTRTGGSTPTWLIQMSGKVHTVCPFLLKWPFPWGDLGFLTAWRLGSQREHPKRSKPKLYRLWPSLRSHKVSLPAEP